MPTPPQTFPATQPLDEHNRALLANVHPPDWVNPEPRSKYHMVVVGGGTGGLVTAAIAAALGARVALVERHLMGGDCLNVGCVPSKALIRSARGWKAAREAAERFAGPAVVDRGGDFGAAMERMRRIRAELSPVDGAARFRGLGVDVFLGDGRFTGPSALEVGGATLRFHRAVVATGGRAAVPPLPGLAEAGYLTNETVFSLTERPESLVVIGAGPIGCELAQAFARLGTRVTVVGRADRILTKDDPEAAQVVAAALERDGVRLALGATVERVERSGSVSTVHYTRGATAESAEGTHLLVAAGRAANVDGLGLEAAGVAYDRKGVTADERLRTTNPRIFAVGDVVAGRWQLTHAADAEARLVIRNAFFFGRGKVGDLVMPWATYTSPEVAHVGLTARDAEKMDGGVETVTVPLREVDRARLDGEDEGFFRVHLKAGSERILGATLVAEHAGEIISQVTQAIAAGTGLGKLGDLIFPYPTQAEVIRKAADQWRRRKLTPLAKSVFGGFFKLIG
ncbi:MAG: mercuric reductase [Gemmatimonadetes bacterium]|nr:mercuric reductase [Gemmatimonadota bacterium]